MRYRLIRTLTVAFAILIGGYTTAHAAQSENWNTPYDALLGQPGTEVSSYLNEKGLQERKLIVPGKTIIIETREGEKMSTLTMDISGLGAVECAWMIYVDTRAALQINGDLESPEAARRLDITITRINKFITENSIEHRPIEELEKAYRARLEDIRREGSDAEVLDAFGDLVERLETVPEEEFDRDIEKFLSVPRLPAMNPCL